MIKFYMLQLMMPMKELYMIKEIYLCIKSTPSKSEISTPLTRIISCLVYI
jgi:hypothetical protein